MSPMEFTPVTGNAGGGRWPRSAAEIEGALEVLGVLLDAMADTPNRSARDLSPAERYTLGIRAAAYWTLGLSDRDPLSGEEYPLTDERLTTTLAVADHLVTAHAPAEDLAAGVRAWLTWITGNTERLAFRAL